MRVIRQAATSTTIDHPMPMRSRLAPVMLAEREGRELVGVLPGLPGEGEVDGVLGEDRDQRQHREGEALRDVELEHLGRPGQQEGRTEDREPEEERRQVRRRHRPRTGGRPVPGPWPARPHPSPGRSHGPVWGSWRSGHSPGASYGGTAPNQWTEPLRNSPDWPLGLREYRPKLSSLYPCSLREREQKAIPMTQQLRQAVTPVPQQWREFARCLGADPDLFYPVIGRRRRGGEGDLHRVPGTRAVPRARAHRPGEAGRVGWSHGEGAAAADSSAPQDRRLSDPPSASVAVRPVRRHEHR